jgi:hypothetical protein
VEGRRKDELGELLDALGNEVVFGRTHLWIYFNLYNALVDRANIAKSARVFFSSTLQAHSDEAFLYLARLLDRKAGATRLRGLLECVDMNAGNFAKASPEKVRTELHPKQSKVLDQMELDAKPVIARRNEALAHLDPKNIGDLPTQKKNWEISFSEMDKLYERAGALINSISSPYRASSRVMDPIVGWEDFREVTRLMEAGKRAGNDNNEGGAG